MPEISSSREPACSYCGDPYHRCCFHCHRPGVPYEYRGITFDGLVARKGERLCRACADRAYEAEGIDILVVDGRPSIPPYVVNTVRDRDVAHIFIPPELRGYDGRDRSPRQRAGKRRGR
jgi:hypothetical protein